MATFVSRWKRESSSLCLHRPQTHQHPTDHRPGVVFPSSTSGSIDCVPSLPVFAVTTGVHSLSNSQRQVTSMMDDSNFRYEQLPKVVAGNF